MALASTFGVILIPVLYVAMQVLREWVKGEYRGVGTRGDTTGPGASAEAPAPAR
jgi:HAE1 family hydrophobic/amphiphilic exporter-1